MSTNRRAQLVLNGPDETMSLAKAIAGFTRAGDTIILSGTLAAGKTTFVKGILASLGSDDLATSPTYAIAHFYRAPKFRILHIDAYRITSSKEFEDLGFDEYADEVLTIVEWGEKFSILRDDRLVISFAIPDGDFLKRNVTIDAHGERWSECDQLFRMIQTLSAA